MSAESKEPRALAAQMRVLKRKEQRILECSFRITRAVAAREDAQRTLAEETRCVCVCVCVFVYGYAYICAQAQEESAQRLGEKRVCNCNCTARRVQP